MVLSRRLVSTYQHDYKPVGARGPRAVRAFSAGPPVFKPSGSVLLPNTMATDFRGGVTVDGRPIAGPTTLENRGMYRQTPLNGVTVDGRSAGAHSRPMGSAYVPSAGAGYSAGAGSSSAPGFASASAYRSPAAPAYSEFPAKQAMGSYVPNRFTPSDWSTSNLSHYNGADSARYNSERVRTEAVRLMRDREDKTVVTQRDADRRIGERMHDINYWRNEIQNELERNSNETANLLDTRNQLERALNETQGPLRVTSECLYHREGRKGIDLVHDAPEGSFLTEVDTIKAAQDRMRRQLQQVDHQIVTNRNTRHNLEKDLSNKDHAMSIDHSCHQLHNKSRSIGLYGGIERLDPNISVPQTWAEHSNSNIQASQAARVSSQRLRGDSDGVVTNCATDMWGAWSSSNAALKQRIVETQDAHNRLSTHLAKTNQEIYDQEKHMEALRKAIRDKEPPLKVSQTRLQARTHRPEIELCRDPPFHRLVGEVGQIHESIDLLQNKLSEAERAHQHLLANRSRLEGDLGVKANSLFIDREKCLSSRKSFPVVSLATKL